MRLEVDIEKYYRGFHLRSAFSVDTERFALLGASGCGKTLTLKCIAGIEKPDRGRITLGDRVLFDAEQRINVPARDRGIGYLFQNYALFPNMTVRQNIFAVAKEKKYAEELLDRFFLREVADQYPAELSGGQSQRTALARMLVTRPKVLLLDEPFSALDNYIRTRVEHEILDLLDTFDGPSVLVTHDRNEAYRLADRIGVMEAGRLVEQQDRQAFFDHPGTVAAARLTGCKNISRLERTSDGSLYAVDWGVTLGRDTGEGAEDATHVGFRAHYFTYIPAEDAAGMEGMVASAETKTSEEGAPLLRCRLQRVIEDTFSVVICFRTEGNPVDTPDALLTWIVNKTGWDAVKDRVLAGTFTLQLQPEKLMLLKDN